MYGCTNCGDHKSETLLLNLETKEIKRLGKLSYFAWKENGNYEYYEYKEYQEKPIDSPLKTGVF